MASWRIVVLALVLGCAQSRWVGSWSASPQDTDEPLQVGGATVRSSVRLSVGGERVRVVVNNTASDRPLAVGALHVAWVGPQGRVDRVVQFHGRGETTVPPRAVAVSDPVALRLPDLAELQVSVFFPPGTSLTTEHSLGLVTTQVSEPGDFTARETFPVREVSEAISPVLDVDVERRASAIVVLGDSMVDGVGSTAQQHRRWPDVLAERLVGSKRAWAVLNQGVGGARLLHDFIGLSGLARFERDVVSKAGVRAVVVELGLNDLGIPGAFKDYRSEVVTADQLIAGYHQLIARGHAAGLSVYATTLGPFEGATRPGYFSVEGERKRQQINHWLRTSRAFDGVIDLDAVLRDPSNPTRLKPDYDSGDHLHPNDAGYRAIAESVDLRWFDAR
jgi:lysophospholipase L1-like esterase